jgi:hypothetical protein
MMSWKINWRIVSGLIGLSGTLGGLLLAQHIAAINSGSVSYLSDAFAFWLSWFVAACAAAATALPSIIGQSSVAPPGISETKVVREATREAVVDILGGNDHPVRRELERLGSA